MRDKGLHLLEGGGISLVAYGLWGGYGDGLCDALHLPHMDPAVVGVAASLAAGALKEALDPLWGGRRELADLAWTLAGGVVAALLGWGVMLAF